jgi:GT2 family glycosyltransferase
MQTMSSESSPRQPQVTVVVVPRERFSRTEISLESLFNNTVEPFELIYLDGHSPPRIRGYLERKAREKRFRLIRLPHFIPTAQSRNIGLREVKTPYVVFMENDVIVRPGWLAALRRCAEETRASVVGPLYLEHLAEREIVHMAGGVAHVEEVEGKRRFIENHFFQGRTLSDVFDKLRREPTELIEFHCVLVRTDVLRQLGGFDEGMKNTSEHIDFCLTMRDAGHQIYFEPASVVVFVQPPPFAWYDLRFFCTRWNDAWARQTVAHLGRKWELDPHDPFLSYKCKWTTVRRRQILTYFWTRARISSLGRRIACRWLTPALDVCIGKTIARPAPVTLDTVAPSARSLRRSATKLR